MTERFPEYSASVRVTDDAPESFRPGALGSVCGFRVLAEPTVFAGLQLAQGAALILVEFGDGTAIELPSCWLISEDVV